MKLKILCIDDSKSVHAFLKQCLDSKLESLTSAYNGEEGLKIIASNKNFDIIFLDWEMPIKTGPETFQELKKSGNRIPVIMLTSKNNTEDVAQMLGMGVAEYIMKPFTQDIIFEKIEMVLG